MNKLVTMRLSEETIAQLHKMHDMLESPTVADTVARSIRVGLLLAQAFMDGEPVVITRADGSQDELVLK